MYLSRLLLNPRSRAVRRDVANCQDLHRTLMRLFPADGGVPDARARYGVLHRLEEDGDHVVLYVQSQWEPLFEGLPAGYTLEAPACKAVTPAYAAIQDGMVLRFRLRANPTRKIDTKTGPDGVKRNGRRVPLGSEEALLVWLGRKGQAGGFRVQEVQVLTGGARSQVVGAKESRALSFEAVTFEGRLVVTDAVVFRETLTRGIGSGKAYGFGLLTVAP